MDGTDSEDLSAIIWQLMEDHRQPAALLSTGGRASIFRSTGEATELGLLDLASSVAVYGRSLGGTGTLTLVRAFVPVGMFGVTVKAGRGEPNVPRGSKMACGG